MPTYEYECRECKHTFEMFQAMSDEPVRICPQCGGQVRRMIGGGTGVIFKGSGFYVNDSKRASSSTSGSGAKSAGSKPAATETASACSTCDACPPSAKKESA